MDILLINPFPYYAEGINETTIQQPLNLLYLASYINKNNFKAQIIDNKVLKLSNEKILEKIKELKPKYVGMAVDAVTQRSSIELAKLIKNFNSNIIVLFGGAQASAIPKKLLENSLADAIIIGEGEYTLLEIIKTSSFEKVKGVMYKKKKEIISNPLRERITNLDELPFPDYNLLPGSKHYFRRVKKNPAFPITTSRGCPYQCTYCAKEVFQNKILFRSVDNVLAEIDYLVKNFNAKQLDLVDDGFLIKRDRAKEILEKILERKYNLAINLQNGIRVDSIDEEMLRIMKKAGVYRIAFGVESGDENVLKKIKKGITLKDVEKAVNLTRSAGIRADCFFMIGLPGDTKESMQKTIDFAKKLKINTPNFSMTIPFPGTELYETIKKEGTFLVDPSNGIETGYNCASPMFELGELKKEVVLEYYKKAYSEFYVRPSQMVKMLLEAKSFSEVKWIMKTGLIVVKNVFKK